MSFEPSKRVLAFLGAEAGIRRRDMRLDREAPFRELEALLFARGFSSFPGALDFERRFGGLSFWAEVPAMLGIASELRRDLRYTLSDLRRGVPIALAEERS